MTPLARWWFESPPQGSAELSPRAKLTVQQHQSAVFFRGGQPFDQFGPGTHDLSSQTLPLLAQEKGDSTVPPAWVYFVGTQTFLHQKWGTKHPILLRDEEFDEVRLRSFGHYAFRISNVDQFLQELVENKSKFTTDHVRSVLQDKIVEQLGRQLHARINRVLDLPTEFDAIAHLTRQALEQDFSQFGLQLTDFFINSISLPKAVQEEIDKEHQPVFRDLRTFTLVQAATNIATRSDSQQFGLQLDNLQPAKPDRVRQLVRSVVDSSGWKLAEQEDVLWQVTVPIGSLRKQTVTIDFSQNDAEGHSLISFTSMCGPASEANAMTLLRYNVTMVHGAFAVQAGDSGEMIVVQGNQLADTADVLEVTRILTAVAWQADRAEERLLGGDQY